MLTLITRLFGLFALKSRKPLFWAGGIVLILLIAAPLLVNPIVKQVSLRSRVNTISKLNSLDKAKMKETALRKGYDLVLADYLKQGNKVAVVVPKNAAKVREYFKKPNFGKIILGSSLWVLLGLIGLFAQDIKPLFRMLVLLLFCALGLISGVLLINLPTLTPTGVYISVVLLSKTALFSVLGTLIREVNRK